MKVVNKTNVIIFSLLVLIISCTKSYQPAEYIQWAQLESTGLRITKDMFPYKFVLQYKSPNYITAINKINGIESELPSEQIIQFNLTIKSLDNKTNPIFNNGTNEDFHKKVQHFNDDGSEDFYLMIGADTILCSFCHMEYNYGVAPLSTIVLAFDIPNKIDNYYKQDWFLVYDDMVFDTGVIKIKIKKNDLMKLNLVKLI